MELNNQKPFTFDRTVRLLITIGIIWLGYLLIRNLTDVLSLFFIALLIAYLINPLVDFVQKYLKYRIPSIILTLLVISGLLVLLGWLIIPLIVQEVNHMWNLLSALVQGGSLTQEVQQRLPDVLKKLFLDFINKPEVKEFFESEQFKDIAQQLAGKLLPGVWGVLSGLVSFVIGLFGLLIIFLYIIFILKDYNVIKEGWKELLPEKYKEPTLEFVYEFKKIMNKYFRGQSLIAGTVGVLFATGFFIIGLPMGILIGLFMGMLNMVPYLQIVGYIPVLFACGIYSLEHQSSFWVILGLATLVIAVVQTFQDTFLVPKIMGHVTGFNPAMILLSLSIWGKLLGIFGLIIALPTTYLILTFYRKYVLKKSVLKIESQNDSS